jgi:hypothetical protein
MQASSQAAPGRSSVPKPCAARVERRTSTATVTSQASRHPPRDLVLHRTQPGRSSDVDGLRWAVPGSVEGHRTPYAWIDRGW